MSVLNGLDAAREIQRVSPRTKTIVLIIYNEDHYILEGLRAGAKGFVLKTHAAEDLVHAIREASRGKMYLSPEISETVVGAYQSRVELQPVTLTPRTAGSAIDRRGKNHEGSRDCPGHLRQDRGDSPNPHYGEARYS